MGHHLDAGRQAGLERRGPAGLVHRRHPRVLGLRALQRVAWLLAPVEGPGADFRRVLQALELRALHCARCPEAGLGSGRGLLVRAPGDEVRAWALPGLRAPWRRARRVDAFSIPCMLDSGTSGFFSTTGSVLPRRRNSPRGPGGSLRIFRDLLEV